MKKNLQFLQAFHFPDQNYSDSKKYINAKLKYILFG